MSHTPAGWYDDGTGAEAKRWWDGGRWTDDRQQPPAGGGPATYVVLQVILKETFSSAGSANLPELELVLNGQAARGYRLHTMTTEASGTQGLGGGHWLLATLVFERIGAGVNHPS